MSRPLLTCWIALCFILTAGLGFQILNSQPDWAGEVGAAWVQAIGSIAAILVAVGAAAYQSKVSRDLLKRQVAEAEHVAVQRVLMGAAGIIAILNGHLNALIRSAASERLTVEEVEQVRQSVLGLKGMLSQIQVGDASPLLMPLVLELHIDIDHTDRMLVETSKKMAELGWIPSENALRIFIGDRREFMERLEVVRQAHSALRKAV